MLIDKLKEAHLAARKERRIRDSGSLSSLIGDCQTLAYAGKGDLSDAAVVTIIKKYLKNNRELYENALRVTTPPSQGLQDLDHEHALYSSFLPKQLDTVELTALIDSMIVDGVLDVGDAMKRLKTDHAGTYDGAEASALLKQKFGKK